LYQFIDDNVNVDFASILKKKRSQSRWNGSKANSYLVVGCVG